MEKGKPLLRWAGILLVGAAISFVCIEARGEKEPAKAPEQAPVTVSVKAPQSGRPDLVKIDTLAPYQKLELPAVTFFHDKHTEALLKEKKDCETCHFVEDGKLSLAFKRQKTTKPAQIQDIYHSNCIGCHMEMAAAGKQSGPPDGLCRSCHNAEPPGALRLDPGLDKVLHFRHADSKDISANTDENCGRCHHEYDKKTKKTFYAKGKEGSCRYCHLDKPQEGVKSLEQAAHLQCVQCHLDLAKKGVKEAGPYLCDGCHGAKGLAEVARKNQAVVAKLPNHEVPRLKRQQPNVVLLTHDPKLTDGKPEKLVTMAPVAFDHQSHEKYNNNCRSCHHASMESCEKCHTLSGAKAGKFVTFDEAMHRKSAPESCTGCHAAKQAAAGCVGCHHTMVETGRPGPDDASCRQCHLEGKGAAGARRDTLAKMTKPQKESLAVTMLQGRPKNLETYPLEDIPDKVVIKELSDKYGPVELSHRKHVVALIKGMKDSQLAAYFHSDPGTLCQGCHHNSPPAKEPPACGNCHADLHGKTAFDAKEANRPGLLAAMHGQCMRCHQDMAVKPVATACTECHEEKKK
jgi:hypothetical protein